MKTNVFLLIALCAFVITSCRPVSVEKSPRTLSKNETKKVSSQEVKTLRVVAKAQINYSETTSQVSVVFDNGWVVIKRIYSLVDETIDSPVYAEKEHTCRVGYDEKGKLFIVENKTMRSMISNK